jgi:hypothetical protein
VEIAPLIVYSVFLEPSRQEALRGGDQACLWKDLRGKETLFPCEVLKVKKKKDKY